MNTVMVATLSPESKVAKRIAAKEIARLGCWAVTPTLWCWNSFDGDSFTVTHVPTGYRVGTATTLPIAKRLLEVMAALPNQDEWIALEDADGMSAEMKRIGKAAVVSVLGAGA